MHASVRFSQITMENRFHLFQDRGAKVSLECFLTLKEYDLVKRAEILSGGVEVHQGMNYKDGAAWEVCGESAAELEMFSNVFI